MPGAKKADAPAVKPPTKAALAKEAKNAAKLVEAQERAEAVTAAVAGDDMIDRSEKYTVSQLFSQLLSRTTFRSRNPGEERRPFDWSDIRPCFTRRTAASPRWFLQIKDEDLTLNPNGMDADTVEVLIIAETDVPTLAPRHCVIKQHRCFMDPEDNAPEKILHLGPKGMGFCWREVTADDGSAINVYLLRDKQAPSAAPRSFSFGGASTGAAAPIAAAPAPALTATGSFGFGGGSFTAAAPTATGVSFGFAQTTTPSATVNFGAAAPAAPSPAPSAVGFGFGAAAAAPAAASASSALPVAPAASARPKLNDVQFTLWSTARVAEMKKDLKTGTRIVREKFSVVPTAAAAAPLEVKLIMQDDLHDSPSKTAVEICQKHFAKQNADMKKLDKWIEDCPIYNPKLADMMQKVRRDTLQEACDESPAWQDLQPMRNAVEAELQRIVAARRAEYESDAQEIAAVEEGLARGLLAPKSAFRLRKYYPKNDVLLFRPFGKVPGITEDGEFVTECVPEAFVVRPTWK